MSTLNGKFVEITGILHFYFEDVAQYPSKNAHSDQAYWLELIIPEGTSDREVEKMNGAKIHIIHKVNTSEKGHLGAYMATLDSAFCIQINQ